MSLLLYPRKTKASSLSSDWLRSQINLHYAKEEEEYPWPSFCSSLHFLSLAWGALPTNLPIFPFAHFHPIFHTCSQSPFKNTNENRLIQCLKTLTGFHRTINAGSTPLPMASCPASLPSCITFGRNGLLAGPAQAKLLWASGFGLPVWIQVTVVTFPPALHVAGSFLAIRSSVTLSNSERPSLCQVPPLLKPVTRPNLFHPKHKEPFVIF